MGKSPAQARERGLIKTEGTGLVCQKYFGNTRPTDGSHPTNICFLRTLGACRCA